MDANKARTVKTTQTSIQILKHVQDKDGATLSDLAEELGRAKSTVHNHLATLTQEGLLVREQRQYHIGLRCLEFGEYTRNRKQLYRPIKIQVYRLAESTNEEANFAVEENGQMYTIEYVMGDANPSNPEAGSQFLNVGSKYRMHGSASGKAILSEYDVESIEQIIDRYGLSATTENTITETEELFEELERIRERGYATNDEELERGYRAIAAPVNGPQNAVIGALSIGGPAYRFKLSEPELNEPSSTLLDAIESVESEIKEMDHLNEP
jgi:IclR family acetate operon transcriptional repressor